MTDPRLFVERAERLIAALAAERDSPDVIADRDYVIGEFRKMVTQVSSGELPPREARYPILAHLVGGQWPLGHPLANEVGAVEALYRGL